MQVPRAGLEAAPSALCILDALLRRRAFFLFNISPLNLRWTMESFQHSEYNELVSAALELVSRLKTRPAGSTLGPGSSTKNNGKARRGAGGEAGSSPLRQRCIWGCSKLSGSPPREDHSFQTFLLTLRLVPSLPFIAFSGGGFCMPNGMLEKALLPGWAPDAMQLIHFYSREQVSRASQAASLKTTLFIWPQALEESEGIGHDSMPTSSRNTLWVPRGAVVQHLRTAASPESHLCSRVGSECSRSVGWHPRPGTRGHRCACTSLVCFGAATFSTAATNPAGPAASRRLYGLACMCIKRRTQPPGCGETPFCLYFPPIPAPVLTFTAQTRMCTSRACPRVRRLRDLQQAGETRYLREGKEKYLLLEPEIAKAKGFVFHPQTTAMW